ELAVAQVLIVRIGAEENAPVATRMEAVFGLQVEVGKFLFGDEIRFAAAAPEDAVANLPGIGRSADHTPGAQVLAVEELDPAGGNAAGYAGGLGNRLAALVFDSAVDFAQIVGLEDPAPLQPTIWRRPVQDLGGLVPFSRKFEGVAGRA